jgi:hypothetical protein
MGTKDSIYLFNRPWKIQSLNNHLPQFFQLKGFQIMSTYNSEYNCECYPSICEFTVPIKLNVPIFIEPTLIIKPVESVREKLHVHLEPDVYLKPEVMATPPVCVPQNGYERQQLSSSQILP